MKPEHLIYKNEKDIEKRVLSHIVNTAKMPLDLKADYFTGQEKRLFQETFQQWHDFGEIDTAILYEKFPELLNVITDVAAIYGRDSIQKLKDAYLWRLIGRVILSTKDEKPDIAINSMLEKLGSESIKTEGEIYNHGEAVKEIREIIDRANKEEREQLGYSTGIRDLDTTTGGIEWGKVYVLGALKKTGKSRFMVYLACKVAGQGAGVMINSLEMLPRELNALALSYLSGENSINISRKLEQNNLVNLMNSMGSLEKINWAINRDYYLTELRSRILYERQKRKVDVVFVDYIQRMRNDEYKGDRVRTVESIAIGLADIAKELNVAMFELAQLSGAAEHLKDEEIPNLSHLKESQGIPETADVIMTMHNPKRREIIDPKNYEETEFKIRVEQRYNISGCVVNIFGNMRNCRFHEGAW